MNDMAQPRPAPSNAVWWRAATIFCVVVIAFATATGISMYEQFTAQITHLQSKLLSIPQIKYIAVLQDEQQAPAMLVTLDPQENTLQIQRLNSMLEGREDTMQLWALPTSGAPRSVGILASTGKTLRLPASEKMLADVSRFAISVESKGGAEPGKGPLLPYLFKGAVVQKAL